MNPVVYKTLTRSWLWVCLLCPGLSQADEFYHLVFSQAPVNALPPSPRQQIASVWQYKANQQNPRSKPLGEFLTLYVFDTDQLSGTLNQPGFKQTGSADEPVFTYQKLGPEISGAGARSYHGGEMKTYDFFVRNGPKTGLDEDYNQWYNNRHILDMCGSSGIVLCQRYRLTDTQLMPVSELPATPYLARYRVVTDDIETFLVELDQRASQFEISPAFDPASSRHFSYDLINAAP